jgi:hypothetical protein
MRLPWLEETAMTQTTTRKDILRRARPAVLALAGVCAFLGACTDNPPKRAQMAADRETFLKYSSAPVDRVTYLGRYYGMRQLGELQFVVWTTINDAYLMKVTPPCVGLDYTTSLRLTSEQNTITKGVDGALVEGQKCFITEIRPVDYQRMRRETNSGP